MNKELLIKDENYLLIQGWMISRLGLKGNELLIFACIYGFCQTEGQVFNGSIRYLQDWINAGSNNTVYKCLNSLLEKNLIIKAEKIINGVKYCEYSINFIGCIKNAQGVQNLQKNVQNLQSGSAKSAHNILDRYTSNNLDKEKEILINNHNYLFNKEKESFKKPTLEEVEAYCKERRNHISAHHFIDYYESNGWKVGRNPMKDWKATIRTWEQKSYKDSKTLPPSERDTSLDAYIPD